MRNISQVKYGDMLRRFNAQIVEEELTLNMDGLRKKILSLFSFAPDTELMLTYIDEDSDVVALVDDDDLHDVVKQGLDPLRITVKVNDGKNGIQCNYSSASSTPLRSPRVQPPLQNLNAGVSEILRKVPEPFRETLVKLSDDLASKASSSAPGLAELVDHFTKVSLSHLGQLSESQPGVRSSRRGGVLESSTVATDTKDSELFKVDPVATLDVPSNVRSDLVSKNNECLEKLKPEATMERNDVKIDNVTGQSMEDSPFDYKAVAAALESLNINVAQPGNDSLRNSVPVHPESGVVSHTVGKKEKVKKIYKPSNGKAPLMSDLRPVTNNVGKLAEFCITSSNLPSVADKNITGKEVCNTSEPKLGSNPASVSASDPTKGDHVNDGTRSVLPDAFGKSPAPIWAPQHGGLNFGSFCGLNTTYECPFSGTVLDNISAAPPHPASDAVPFRRSFSQNDGSGNIFHRGVRCDGCGVHPITGPRFKSKV